MVVLFSCSPRAKGSTKCSYGDKPDGWNMRVFGEGEPRASLEVVLDGLDCRYAETVQELGQGMNWQISNRIGFPTLVSVTLTPVVGPGHARGPCRRRKSQLG